MSNLLKLNHDIFNQTPKVSRKSSSVIDVLLINEKSLTTLCPERSLTERLDKRLHTESPQSDFSTPTFEKKRHFYQQSYSSTTSYKQIPKAKTARLHDEEMIKAPSKMSFTNNFSMSKQQCENFLRQVHEELINERNELENCTSSVKNSMIQKLQKNYENFKKDLITLLDRSYQQYEAHLLQDYFKHSDEANEINTVKFEIERIDNYVQSLLRQLKGFNFRKAIADVVTKDFAEQVRHLKDSVYKAKIGYLDSFGKIQIDEDQAQFIKNEAKNLFGIRKKSNKVAFTEPVLHQFIHSRDIREHDRNAKENGKDIKKRSSYPTNDSSPQSSRVTGIHCQFIKLLHKCD